MYLVDFSYYNHIEMHQVFQEDHNKQLLILTPSQSSTFSHTSDHNTQGVLPNPRGINPHWNHLNQHINSHQNQAYKYYKMIMKEDIRKIHLFLYKKITFEFLKNSFCFHTKKSNKICIIIMVFKMFLKNLLNSLSYVVKFFKKW